MDWTDMPAGQLLLGSGLQPGQGGEVQPVLAGGVVAEIAVVVAVGTVETVAAGVAETVVEIVVEVVETAEIGFVETVVALQADVFLGQSCWAIFAVVVGIVGIEVLAVGIAVEVVVGFD